MTKILCAPILLGLALFTGVAFYSVQVNASSTSECYKNPVSCGISKSDTFNGPSGEEQKNVLHRPLTLCSRTPLAGFFRTGFCQTDATDSAVHTVCAVMTDEFLKFSKSRGNDLISENQTVNFPGLKSGQRWCLCAARWKEAHDAGHAPKVVLDATHEKTLETLELVTLQKNDAQNRR